MQSNQIKSYLLEKGLKNLPRLMTLFNHNRLSKNYGCFDRAYWHYRVTDFPSGVFQYGALALACGYQIDAKENPFYRSETTKEFIWAAIDFATRSGHKDGSCDDYYFNERAAGATAFSLYVLTEAYLLMQFEDPQQVKFFERRADWLIKNNEPYPLANHQALIALGLYNVFLITGEENYRKQAERQINKVLGLQSPEGWFEEYGGPDAGYMSFSINFLGKYYQKSKDKRLEDPLKKAVKMASFFLHPDGSYGGDYGSRSTNLFLIHGFEIAGSFYPPSSALVDCYIRGCLEGRGSYPEDDRIISLMIVDYLQSYSDFCNNRIMNHEIEEGIYQFPQAGMVVLKTKDVYWVISARKAGSNRFFIQQDNSYNDCGFIAQLMNGQRLATYHSDQFSFDQQNKIITIRGHFHRYLRKMCRVFICWRFFLKYLSFYFAGLLIYLRGSKKC